MPDTRIQLPTSLRRMLVRWSRWSAVALCGVCGCAGLNDSMVRVSHTTQIRAQSPSATPRSRPGRASLNTNANPSVARTRSGSQASDDIRALQATLPPYRAFPRTQQAVRPRSSIRQTSMQDEFSGPFESAPSKQYVRAGAIERVAASARTPALCPDPFGVGQAWDESEASPTAYPDEYLFDGGDRGYPIGADNGFDFQGLETEDTIAEYKDHEDNKKVKHSNRLAIYAPRFGSVISISGPNSDTLVDKIHGHVVAQKGIGLGGREGTSTKRQTVETGRLQTRSRSTIVGTDIGTDSMHNDLNREVSVSVLNTHERFGQQRINLLEDKLRPYSRDGMAFAEHWSRTDFPVLQGLSISASQDVKVQVQAEFVGLEDFGKRGDLRLHKTADKGSATIGETITFTIHYENRGDKPLKSVVIIDNLTPRLEFIAGSDSSDRPGKVEVVDNGEGSVILRFVLNDNLPGRTKGSITFQAKVR